MFSLDFQLVQQCLKKNQFNEKEKIKAKQMSHPKTMQQTD